MMTKRAFTLVETIIALAIFTLIATVIGQAIFNIDRAISFNDKDAKEEALREFLRYEVLQITSLDELESSFDSIDLDGDTIQISCEVETTPVADLFKIYANYKNSSYDINDEYLVIRTSWYDSTDDRQELIDDRTDELDTLRGN